LKEIKNKRVRKREKERNDREENNVKKKKRSKSLSFSKLAFPVSGLVWVFIFLQKKLQLAVHSTS
jgi:hypothetical protein